MQTLKILCISNSVKRDLAGVTLIAEECGRIHQQKLVKPAIVKQIIKGRAVNEACTFHMYCYLCTLQLSREHNRRLLDNSLINRRCLIHCHKMMKNVIKYKKRRKKKNVRCVRTLSPFVQYSATGCAAAETLHTDTSLDILRLPCMCFDCNHKTYVTTILPAL